MKEYKVVGYSWSNASVENSLYGHGYSVNKYEQPVMAEDLSDYGRYGWHVAGTWRTETGIIWVILER